MLSGNQTEINYHSLISIKSYF